MLLRRLLTTVLALSATPALAAAPSPISEVRIERTSSIMGRSLALTLSELPALEATHVATSWALSTERTRRAAVAEALEWVFPLTADRLIVDHLSRDPDVRIRAACARAAWIRGIETDLASDEDPEVRAIAARGR